MRKLTMLGTGNAMVTKCYNTCFYVTLDDGALFLTDAGGGNGILRQLELTGFDYQKCHHMFVTHGHTDHVLGVISRVASQLSVFAIGFPITLGVGLVGITATLPLLQAPFTMALERMLSQFQ